MTANDALTPKQIAQELDRHIVGQSDAKRAVAIALRNRWRRMQLDPELRDEVSPKNILMIGPTGVGKTEIARRLARLANAPLIKVEATKFTEVGYVGRDVESIIRDLADTAVNLLRQEQMQAVAEQAEDRAEDRILDALLPEPRNADSESESTDSTTRQMFRKKLREGELDDKEIDVELEQVSVGDCGYSFLFTPCGSRPKPATGRFRKGCSSPAALVKRCGSPACAREQPRASPARSLSPPCRLLCRRCCRRRSTPPPPRARSV